MWKTNARTFQWQTGGVTEFAVKLAQYRQVCSSVSLSVALEQAGECVQKLVVLQCAVRRLQQRWMLPTGHMQLY